MSLPEQLLLSDLLRRRVRCDRGLEHGGGSLGWMHPPVHRLLGWASRPSAFSQRRLVWRLDQLCGLGELEVFVEGDPAETDQATLERLPTLIDAALTGAGGEPLGTVADAAIELRTGRIRHYLVSRSDPRLPGGSRWRLSPERITDQQPGRVMTALQGLDDLPLARASVRQEFLRRSRRWRDQMGEETARLRDQLQQAGGQLEDRLEGWLEEPPWEESPSRDRFRDGLDDEPPRSGPDPLEDWEDEPFPPDPPDPEEPGEPDPRERRREPPPRSRRESAPPRYRGRDGDDDPWI